MSQVEKALDFAELHKTGEPVVLYNIWDAGGAKAMFDEGARAIATSSWAMAAAQGYDDGEAMPMDLALRLIERVCSAVDVPVTVDFEGGYATDPDAVAKNVLKVLQAGAIGINFEDRVVKGEGLYSLSTHAARIQAIKSVAKDANLPVFLNARTDLFLGHDPATHEANVPKALEREAAYAEAGADCFFTPGLTDPSLISRIADAAHLPINVMMMGDLVDVEQVASLGVARVSYGPGPYLRHLAALKAAHAETC